MNFKVFLLPLLMISFGFCKELIAQSPSSLPLNRLISEVRTEGLAHSYPKVQTLATDFKGKLLSQDALAEALKKMYLIGSFKKIDTSFLPSRNSFILTFSFEENATIKQIALVGNSEVKLSALLKDVDTKVGVPYNYKNLERDIPLMESNAILKGYDLFKIESVTFDPDQTLSIHAKDTQIESISFLGLHKIQDFVVRRALKSKVGHSFNSKTIRQDREKLLKMGYFADVSAPQLEESKTASHCIGVSLAFTERKFNLFDLGLEQENQGYDKVVAFLQTNVNHTVIHSDSLLGKIQFGNDNGGTYKIINYTIKYEQPWFLNMYNFSVAGEIWNESRKEFLSTDLQNETIVDTSRIGSQLSLGLPLLDSDMMLSFRVKKEEVMPLPGVSQTASFNAYSIHSLGTGLYFKRVSDAQNPKEGGYISIEYEKSGNFGLFTLPGLDFNRGTLNWAYFLGFNDRDTLGIHQNLGFFNSSTPGITTEPELFLLGGSGSLRGYKETNPFVGKRKTLVNIEFRHDFSTNFQGIIFYDFGRTFETGLDYFNFSECKIGKGVGVRFFTPLGPLRFDLAWGDDLILHFGLGQVF